MGNLYYMFEQFSLVQPCSTAANQKKGYTVNSGGKATDISTDLDSELVYY